jgi:ATP synthase protein I
MSDSDKPPSLKELGTRIDKVRHEAGLDAEGEKPEEPPPSGELGMAWRISIEIVVALALCTGLGWVLDQWLGTTPWLMVVFLFLGAAAGINNAIRTMNRMDALAAEREKALKGEAGDGRKREGEGGRRA